MSVFSQLLASALDSGSSSAILRDVHPLHVIDEEQPLYQFVTQHARRYGALPSEPTLNRAGFTLPDYAEPVGYYLERLRVRNTYNVISDRHPALNDAMRTQNMDQAVQVLRDMLASIGAGGGNARYTTLAAESQNVIEQYRRMKFRTGLAGITFGWPTLDHLTLGAMGGDLIVFAGRPSIGKSWLMFSAAMSAWLSGKSIAIGSMEMPDEQVTRRWMGLHLGINPNFIRAGQLSMWREENLLNYTVSIANMPPVHLMAGEMSKNVAALEAIFDESLPDVLYIDAAYLLSPSTRGQRSISKWEAIADVMKELKQLGTKYNRPIFITVQFNRNVRKDSRREVDLGDIAGSDSIPQDASIVCGITRGVSPNEESRRLITVLKNREGSTGKFETDFLFTPPSMDEVTNESDQQRTGPLSLGWMA